MFFLFGWGHQTTKNYGPTLPIRCPNCNNDTVWHLGRTKTWFTLFFIPVIPYRTDRYYVCEICAHGKLLDSAEFEEAVALNERTQAPTMETDAARHQI